MREQIILFSAIGAAAEAAAMSIRDHTVITTKDDMPNMLFGTIDAAVTTQTEQPTNSDSRQVRRAKERSARKGGK